MSQVESNETSSSSSIAQAKAICNNIQHLEKRAKKQALLRLQTIVTESDNEPDVLHRLFVETQMYILGGFRDRSELIRETSMDVMRHFIDRLPPNDYYLAYIFPVIVERIGTAEPIEESEEVRLSMVQFLNDIVKRYALDKALRVFINESVQIYSQTVTDIYPAVKEESCRGIRAFAAAVPNEFHYQAECLIKPVLTAFSHQRYKVRVEAIKCIGDIIMHSSGTGLDMVVTPLAERLFDRIPAVRVTISRIAARWLKEYRDRYSYWHKILPLILTGLNDEVPETREETRRLWLEVGLQYEKENEQNLKDKSDYLYAPPLHYPPNVERPNLGCRELVQSNVVKLAGALSREMGSWQEDIRFRCSQLLCSVVLHAEENLTQHLQDLLPAMYYSAIGDDKKIVCNVLRASEYIGYFVPVKVWIDLTLPIVQTAGHLAVLAAVIKGTEKDKLVPHLEDIATVIADKEICTTFKRDVQTGLLECVRNVLSVCDDDASSIVSECLFVTVVTVCSLRSPNDSDLVDLSVLDEMARRMKLDNSVVLWKKHVAFLLDRIKEDASIWTVANPDRCVFETVILHSGPAFGENLPLIGTILTDALDIESDPESKLKIFVALSMTLLRKDEVLQNSVELDDFLQTLVRNILVPSLTWHAGCVAEAMRTMAVSCLCSALSPGLQVNPFPSSDTFRPIFDELIPLLISLTEDASYRSRQLALEALGQMKCWAVKKHCWTTDDVVKIYQVVLNRFDDPTDKVRIGAIKTLPIVLDNSPKEFSSVTYKSHHELICDTVLTHFDDHDEDVQLLIFGVLKTFAAIGKDYLRDKVSESKSVLRNQAGCDELLKYLENLNVSID